MPELLQTAGAALDFQGKVHYDNLAQQSVQVLGRLHAAGLRYRRIGEDEAEQPLLDTAVSGLNWRGAVDFRSGTASQAGTSETSGRGPSLCVAPGYGGAGIWSAPVRTRVTARPELCWRRIWRTTWRPCPSGADLTLEGARATGAALNWTGAGRRVGWFWRSRTCRSRGIYRDLR